MTAPSLLSLDSDLGLLIGRTMRAIRRRYTEIAAAYDLTERQAAVLWVLFHEDGASAVRIVERLESDSSTVGALLDRLQAKGLLVREPDPDDRRVNRHLLTPKARELQVELMAQAAELNQRLCAALEPGEYEAFRATLGKILDTAQRPLKLEG